MSCLYFGVIWFLMIPRHNNWGLVIRGISCHSICFLLLALLNVSFLCKEAMPGFAVDSFVTRFQSQPDKGEIDNLKKCDLIDLCKYYALDVTTVTKKDEFKQLVLKHFVEIGLLSKKDVNVDVKLKTGEVLYSDTDAGS